MNEDQGRSRTGWKRVRIRDVSKSIQYGHTASAIDKSDGPRFLRITDIQNGHVDWSSVPSCDIPTEEVPKYRLHKGDLVFARTGATTGKSFLIDDCPDAVFASYLIRIAVSSDIDPRYLAAYFQSPDYWQQIEGGKRGIGQPNVNGNVLGDILFPLAPMEEQRQIVAEIEKQFTRLEAGVAALRRVHANLKRYRASVLKDACEGRLVPTEAELARTEGRSYESADKLLARILTERRKIHDDAQAASLRKKKYKEPTSLSILTNEILPDGWAWAKWDQIGFSQNGRPFPSAAYQSEGFKLLRPGNLHASGKIVWTEDNIRCMPQKFADENTDLIVRGGELVMNLTAQSLKDEFLGRVCLTEDGDECLLNQRLARLTPIIVSSKFALYLLKSWRFRRVVDGFNSGSLIQHMFTSQLAEFTFPLPPLAEQKRIVAEVERRLSVADQLEAAVSANLQRATRLRQSILQNAFTDNN
jgi:type I restriction enzyme, S subunit